MRKMSIRRRLMIMLICLTTLLVVTLTLIATINTRQSVEKEIIQANISRMEWANQYLDELIQQVDIMFYTLQINEKLMASLRDVDSPIIGVQYRTQQYIGDMLTSIFHANSRKVDSLTLYVHDVRKAFSVDFASSGLTSSPDIRQGPWSRILQTPINIYFKQTSDGIYAYHSINRFEDRKLLGGLSVHINQEVWDQVRNILKSEDESSIFLMNDEGELLSGSSPSEDKGEIQTVLNQLDNSDSELIYHKTANYMFFTQKIHDGRLHLVKAIPLETINRSAQPTISAGIVTGSTFVGISILLSILFSLHITKPIVGLAKTMRRTHIQNFETKSVQGSDEIVLLQMGYNSMMRRIKELIEVEYQGKIDIKTAQLQALQAQINPHFLNNTLQLIGGMAMAKNAPEIYRITRSIGELLRYSISTDGDLVTLNEEIKHLKNYIYIQENRFTGRCKIDIQIDASITQAVIPKFTLQPIVENAFEHGLQQQVGAWELKIRVAQVGQRIVIMVLDGGVGLTRERLHQVREHLSATQSTSITNNNDSSKPRKRKSIGMRNVHSRLQLQFGQRYGVHIFSSHGTGTLVVLMIPCPQQEV